MKPATAAQRLPIVIACCPQACGRRIAVHRAAVRYAARKSPVASASALPTCVTRPPSPVCSSCSPATRLGARTSATAPSAAASATTARGGSRSLSSTQPSSAAHSGLRLMKVSASAADVSKNDTVKPHETSAWKQPASRRCSGAAAGRNCGAARSQIRRSRAASPQRVYLIAMREYRRLVARDSQRPREHGVRRHEDDAGEPSSGQRCAGGEPGARSAGPWRPRSRRRGDGALVHPTAPASAGSWTGDVIAMAFYQLVGQNCFGDPRAGDPGTARARRAAESLEGCVERPSLVNSAPAAGHEQKEHNPHHRVMLQGHVPRLVETADTMRVRFSRSTFVFTSVQLAEVCRARPERSRGSAQFEEST